jgi:hypothetical protein
VAANGGRLERAPASKFKLLAVDALVAGCNVRRLGVVEMAAWVLAASGASPTGGAAAVLFIVRTMINGNRKLLDHAARLRTSCKI